MPTLVFCKSFADVPLTDKGVDTPTFLEASDGLVKLFGETVYTYTIHRGLRSAPCLDVFFVQIYWDLVFLDSSNQTYEAT